MVGFGAVAGAWDGRRHGSLAAVAGDAMFFSLVSAVVALTYLGVVFAGLRRLAPADRLAVIDAVRFGRSVGDPRLVDALLAYTASSGRLASPSSVNANTLALWLTAGLCLFAAAVTGRRGDLPETVFLCAAAGSAFAAMLWPAVGQACRRNIAAAEQATLALRVEAEPLSAAEVR